MLDRFKKGGRGSRRGAGGGGGGNLSVEDAFDASSFEASMSARSRNESISVLSPALLETTGHPSANGAHSYSYILPDVAADQPGQCSPRLFDYLLVFQRGAMLERDEKTAAEKPYKALTDVMFQPELLDRYPQQNWPGQELTAIQSLLPFIFPDEYPAVYLKKGVPGSRTPNSIERKSTVVAPTVIQADFVSPRFHWLVLTDAGGARKQYVCVFRFWEELSAIQVLNLHKTCKLDSELLGEEPMVYSPKALVLISRWPFLGTMRDVLKSLYTVSCSQSPVPRMFYGLIRLLIFSS
jgi:hypothetical protein